LNLNPLGIIYAGGTNLGPGANATGLYSVSSGALFSDVYAEITFALSASAAAASPAHIELWAKQFSASYGYTVRFEPNPHSLQIRSYTSAGASTMASAGIASTLASGVYQGHGQRLGVSVQGGAIAAYLGTSAGAAVLSASNGAAAQPGWPALGMGNGSPGASSFIYADDFLYRTLAGGASDIGPREWFRFETAPERRVYQGNASFYFANRAADFRGEHPLAPITGSPGPSGPAQMVVFSGDPDNFVGNDLMDVSLSVRDRFRFLR
jgi:hypothetical protein